MTRRALRDEARGGKLKKALASQQVMPVHLLAGSLECANTSLLQRAHIERGSRGCHAARVEAEKSTRAPKWRAVRVPFLSFQTKGREEVVCY